MLKVVSVQEEKGSAEGIGGPKQPTSHHHPPREKFSYVAVVRKKQEREEEQKAGLGALWHSAGILESGR